MEALYLGWREEDLEGQCIGEAGGERRFQGGKEGGFGSTMHEGGREGGGDKGGKKILRKWRKKMETWSIEGRRKINIVKQGM